MSRAPIAPAAAAARRGVRARTSSSSPSSPQSSSSATSNTASNNNNNNNNNNSRTRRRSSSSSASGVLHSRVSARTASPGASTSSSSSSYDSCEGYVRIKKRSALTWSTRFAVLRGAELYVFYSKQDATLRRNLVDAFMVASGRIAPRMDLGLELLATDAREFQARVFSRGDLARWVTAFHRLAVRTEAAEAAAAASSVSSSVVASAATAASGVMAAGAPRASRAKRMRIGSVDSAMPSPLANMRASERSSAYASEAQTDETVSKSGESESDSDDDSDEERNPVVVAPSATPEATPGRQSSARRRVSFNGSVMVRLIPALEQEQVAELFYSKKEVERFSAQATSLLSRTEDAVSCAYLALRRGPTTLLPWRRQVA